MPVTEERIHRLIAMSPNPIGRHALVKAFDDLDADQVDEVLSVLVSESKIAAVGKGYVAARPWADIAYGVVGPIDRNKRTHIPVTLVNMPEDSGMTVVMTRNNLYRHNLIEGDRLVVGLGRSATDPYRFHARFIEKLEDSKSYFIPGIYNYEARIFTPLDRSIKTAFTLASAPAAPEVPRQFLAELRPHFDMREPVIHVADEQARNVVTGEAISWIVASKHGISPSYDRHTLKEAAQISRRKLSLDGRTDLRHLDFVTVDPLEAVGLDDGFAAEMVADGYMLYTAIADVPAHVLHNTFVDREAYDRGVSYYFKDFTAHMLPPALSMKKCSLLPNEDRLALVVRQKLDWDCALRDYDVTAAVIRSRTQLTYGQFYDLLEQDHPRFRAIATIHDTRRRQPVSVEIKPFLKEDPGQYTTKSIVETLMVQTNVLLAKYLKSAGAPFQSRNFDKSTGDFTGGRGMVPRAYYSPQALGHAQIGMLYAHFTSPIRRYADIFNIRAVHKVLGNRAYAISQAEIDNQDKIAAHLNSRHLVERDIEHDVEKYHAMRDLERLKNAPIRLNIYEIGPDFVEVFIPQTGIRQRLSAAALDKDLWRIDSERHELVQIDPEGQEVRRYGPSNALLGRLYDVDPVRARWSIALLPQEQVSRPAKIALARPT